MQFLPVCCTQKQLENEEGAKNKEVLMYEIASAMARPLESGVWFTAEF